jgi:hypothetical protein
MFFEQRIPNKAHAAHGALELDPVEELHLSQVWFPIIREDALERVKVYLLLKGGWVVK